MNDKPIYIHKVLETDENTIGMSVPSDYVLTLQPTYFGREGKQVFNMTIPMPLRSYPGYACDVQSDIRDKFVVTAYISQSMMSAIRDESRFYGANRWIPLRYDWLTLRAEDGSIISVNTWSEFDKVSFENKTYDDQPILEVQCVHCHDWIPFCKNLICSKCQERIGEN